MRGSVRSPTSVGHGPIEVNIYREGLLMGDKKGFQNINMVFTMEEVPHLSFFCRTEKKKNKKTETSLRLRKSVESPTSTKYGPIEVNINGGTE